jgi:transcriptional regulator with XRE-family HTH domain
MTGEQIRQQRETLGLTQAQLAVKAGISVTAIANWEQGKSTPSTTSLERLMEAFFGSGVTGFQPREVRSVRQFEGVIDAATFKTRFGLPANATITLVVPGADNSAPLGVALENKDFEFQVNWTEEK